MCNSLNPSAWYEQNEDFETAQLVMLANPLSSDLNVMRQTLLFGGLNSIAWNINRQNPDLKLYELGHSYFRIRRDREHPVVSDFLEMEALDLFITGNTSRQRWNSGSNPTDFFNVKSAVEMIFSRLGINPYDLALSESSKSYYSESLVWTHNKKELASAGKVSKPYLQKFDIRQDVYYAHIEWDLLMEAVKNKTISFNELPKYPFVRRDLALLIDRDVKFSRIREIAFNTERHILKDVDLFDVYESDSLGINKKSYAVSFILRDDLRTLTDKSIDKVMDNLIRAYGKELNAQIR
jgi:phenylalanyl-tRNA synthetase beta chain